MIFIFRSGLCWKVPIRLCARNYASLPSCLQLWGPRRRSPACRRLPLSQVSQWQQRCSCPETSEQWCIPSRKTRSMTNVTTTSSLLGKSTPFQVISEQPLSEIFQVPANSCWLRWQKTTEVRWHIMTNRSATDQLLVNVRSRFLMKISLSRTTMRVKWLAKWSTCLTKSQRVKTGNILGISILAARQVSQIQRQSQKSTRNTTKSRKSIRARVKS